MIVIKHRITGEVLISAMDHGALEWWQEHKPLVLAFAGWADMLETTP